MTLYIQRRGRALAAIHVIAIEPPANAPRLPCKTFCGRSYYRGDSDYTVTYGGERHPDGVCAACVRAGMARLHL